MKDDNRSIMDRYFQQDYISGERRGPMRNTNLHIVREGTLGWSLENYSTRMCFFYNDRPDVIFFNTTKYSVTTSKIQSWIWGSARQNGKTLYPTDGTTIKNIAQQWLDIERAAYEAVIAICEMKRDAPTFLRLYEVIHKTSLNVEIPWVNR